MPTPNSFDRRLIRTLTADGKRRNGLQSDCPKAGHIDLVCSNAGIGNRGSNARQTFDPAVLGKLFEINFYAALRIAKTYSELLENSDRRGRLMVTASENSLSVPSAIQAGKLAMYGASKHALLIAMEWLRIEQQGGCLDLHVLFPGAVYTPLIAAGLPDPKLAPPELGLIMPHECAEIALRGIDLDLFYIPTHAHLPDDMQPRLEGIRGALEALGIRDPGQ